MKRILVSLALLASISDATAGNVPPPARIASVTANLSLAGLTIPTNFAGFSYETSDLIGGYLQGTTGVNGSLIGCINLLGSSGVLRIGGASSDSATPPALTSGIASNLATFVAGLGASWSVIYGLDLFANDSTTAASQAGMLNTALGSKVTFQFGNESNAYLNSANYTTRWNAYYTAVTATVPGAPAAAADIGNFGSDQSYTSSLTPGIAGLAALTNHWYNPNPMANAYQIVNSPFSYGTATGFYLNQSYAGNTPLLMTESNTVSIGGQAGVSDRLASASWFVNSAIILANANWKGLYVHNGVVANVNAYRAFTLNGDNTFTPQPVFYGMLAWSKIQGQQTVQTSIGGNATVNAIATKGANGNANFLIANNDVFGPVTVFIDQSSAWSTATVLQVKSGTGAGCTDSTATIGGAAIDKSGAWAGASFSIAKGAPVVLGPCEMAFVSIQP